MLPLLIGNCQKEQGIIFKSEVKKDVRIKNQPPPLPHF